MANTSWAAEPPIFTTLSESGRDGEIRTHDFLLPKQALYQAELRPENRHPELEAGAHSGVEYKERKKKAHLLAILASQPTSD
jgi:hypothetical protein